MKSHYINVNTNKLHGELISHGIHPILVENDLDIESSQTIADNTYITFAVDTDMQLVQSIIDAHDPTPNPPAPTADDFLLDIELRVTMLELGL